MSSYKKALLSNKEDTKESLIVIGNLITKINELNEFISSLETRLKRSHKITNISIPIMFVAGSITGIGSYYIYKGVYEHDSEMLKIGTTLTAVGVSGFIGFEIIYNFGGSTKIKLW